MIRQFDPRDAEACFELLQDCIRQDRLLGPELRRALLEAESADSIRQRAALFYLAVYDTGPEIAGLAGLEMNEIRLLFVAPEYQGQRIGTALLEHLEAMVPPALFREVFVYSTRAAEPFYRNQGYEPRGEHVFDIGGQPLETVFMVKPMR